MRLRRLRVWVLWPPRNEKVTLAEKYKGIEKSKQTLTVPDTLHSSEIVQNGFPRGYFWFCIHYWWEQAKKMTLKFFWLKGWKVFEPHYRVKGGPKCDFWGFYSVFHSILTRKCSLMIHNSWNHPFRVLRAPWIFGNFWAHEIMFSSTMNHPFRVLRAPLIFWEFLGFMKSWFHQLRITSLRFRAWFTNHKSPLRAFAYAKARGGDLWLVKSCAKARRGGL